MSVQGSGSPVFLCTDSFTPILCITITPPAKGALISCISILRYFISLEFDINVCLRSSRIKAIDDLDKSYMVNQTLWKAIYVGLYASDSLGGSGEFLDSIFFF
jgi:hypothetical protein